MTRTNDATSDMLDNCVLHFCRHRHHVLATRDSSPSIPCVFVPLSLSLLILAPLINLPIRRGCPSICELPHCNCCVCFLFLPLPLPPSTPQLASVAARLRGNFLVKSLLLSSFLPSLFPPSLSPLPERQDIIAVSILPMYVLLGAAAHAVWLGSQLPYFIS